MENVSNIFYFENLVIGGQDYEDFIVYEVVYQWFGNSVMEGNWYYIWLSEGFVIYGANFYIEYKYGWDVMAKWLFIECQQVLQFVCQFNCFIIDIFVINWNCLLNVNVYQKGNWVLYMLWYKVGEWVFWLGLCGYYKVY